MATKEQAKITLENLLRNLRGPDDNLITFAFEQCAEDTEELYGTEFVKPYVERYKNIIHAK